MIIEKFQLALCVVCAFSAGMCADDMPWLMLVNLSLAAFNALSAMDGFLKEAARNDQRG